ncbi:hypothetical protein NDS46_10505 [Paenibacillus thiaminolyticus]|uniref:hypothetical protein n=1 Tax=Paenibacillus thiaminolyticus TaxID=49283 RepID=UPI00232E4579|nr:hypothetical protein [Paenibacillus thiaminolyticus]WCF10242.1 hypothetical protein NDS46_10505 [Paenibacillus thiaminolyticus]
MKQTWLVPPSFLSFRADTRSDACPCLLSHPDVFYLTVRDGQMPFVSVRQGEAAAIEGRVRNRDQVRPR